MEKIISYILEPQTIISIVVLVFGLGGIRASIKSQLSNHDERIKKLESLDLEGKFGRIMTDLERLKNAQMNKNK